jgi:uncharacterized protein HemY
LLLGRVYLRGGRAADAVEALKIAIWSEATVPAHLALAEAFLQVQDQAAARAEVERALALDPESAEALALKARLGGPPHDAQSASRGPGRGAVVKFFPDLH